VVLGGHSASSRDAHMRDLISDHIKEAALRRTSPVVAEKAERAEKTERAEEPQRPVAAKVTLAARADVAPAASVKAAPSVGSNDPMQPLLVRTITYRTAPIQTAALTPMPALQPTATHPAAPAARPQQVAELTVSSEPAPSEPAARFDTAKVETAKPETAKPEPAKVDAAKAQPAKAELPKSESQAPTTHAHSGWLIQIGAFEAEDEAKQHLSAAQTKVRTALAAADPFTERIQKGDKALYRARFAGFDRATAEATCKQLKRNDIDCMALKN